MIEENARLKMISQHQFKIFAYSKQQGTAVLGVVVVLNWYCSIKSSFKKYLVSAAKTSNRSFSWWGTCRSSIKKRNVTSFISLAVERCSFQMTVEMMMMMMTTTTCWILDFSHSSFRSTKQQYNKIMSPENERIYSRSKGGKLKTGRGSGWVQLTRKYLHRKSLIIKQRTKVCWGWPSPR